MSRLSNEQLGVEVDKATRNPFIWFDVSWDVAQILELSQA